MSHWSTSLGRGSATLQEFRASSRSCRDRDRCANMCSMTSEGHPYARFRRALATGNARIAEAAARDLQQVGLRDALELVLLYRDDPERYERAAARWIGRLVAERRRLRLSEVELAAGAFREAAQRSRRRCAARLLVIVSEGGAPGRPTKETGAPTLEDNRIMVSDALDRRSVGPGQPGPTPLSAGC